jgi:hypothetical protein
MCIIVKDARNCSSTMRTLEHYATWKEFEDLSPDMELCTFTKMVRAIMQTNLDCHEIVQMIYQA